MSQVDTSAGDSTPKLIKASLIDITTAINRLCYAFKTSDGSVAPDCMQLAADGNLSLGDDVPLGFNTYGRVFNLSNKQATGATNAMVHIGSQVGNAYLRLNTPGGGSFIQQFDGNSTTIPAAEISWSSSEGLWRLKTNNSGTQITPIKVSRAGKIGLGENSELQVLLNVGVAGQAGNELWVPSKNTNFEGAYLGAYDANSGAKLDLNTAANTTNVSSWRMSHDSNVGGQGRLSFSFAAATTSRGGLQYAEKVAFTNGGMLLGGAQSRSVAGAVRYFQIENTGQASISMVRNTNDVNGANISMGKSRGTVNGAVTIVQDGDGLGGIQWAGANGTDMNSNAVQIAGYVSGAPTATSIPGMLVISTTRVGDSGLTEALRVTNQQNVSIGGASDVAKLVVLKGVTYPSGEGMVYLQSSAPATVPVMITGSSSGTISISGGSPLPGGGARGGQIDLIAGGAPTMSGNVVIRTGTNADGQPGSNVFTYNAAGMFGVNTLNPLHRFYAVGNTGERIRLMMDTFGEYAGMTGRRANGTAAAPTKILNGDQMLFMNVHGYTGTIYQGSCGAIGITADGDWSDAATPTAIYFSPGSPTSVGQNQRAVFTSAGRFGFNQPTPISIMNVTHPNSPNGVGFEVDPDVANNFVQLRSYDRSVSQYKGWAQAASQFSWGVGNSSAALIGAFTTAGNFVVGQNANLYVAGQGTGNQMIDGQFIISANSYGSTAMCISAGEKYAGMKIKVGPNTNPNGGADYYDITTRPGPQGVANNADRVMIRLENALQGVANPNIYLQPNGEGGHVIIGANTSATTGMLQVVSNNGQTAFIATGNNTTQSAGDIVVLRSGAAVSSVAGYGSCIQLGNSTNNTHVILQESAAGFGLWNNNNSVWAERMYMAASGRFTFGAHTSAAGSTAETVQVVGGLAGPSEYCYFAQANTASAQAYAMRMYSSSTSLTVGSITFTGSATAYNQSSDRRIKEHILPADSAMAMVRAWNVVKFNFKADGSFWPYGFIAQDLYKTSPFAVTKGSDDDEKFCTTNGVWGVDNSKLVPVLAKSQQELMDELDATKADLAATKATLEATNSVLADVLARLAKLEGK